MPSDINCFLASRALLEGSRCTANVSSVTADMGFSNTSLKAWVTLACPLFWDKISFRIFYDKRPLDVSMNIMGTF